MHDQPPELHEASLGWLLATWQVVSSERLGLAQTLPCVEPPEAADDLRETILRDYETIKAEIERRQGLVHGLLSTSIGDDGCVLVLYPDPPAAP
jgi:hypothetical protein